MKKLNVKKCLATLLAITLVVTQFGGYISADAADERYVMTPADLNNIDGETNNAISEVTTHQGVNVLKITPNAEATGDIKRDRWNLAGKNISTSDYKYVAVDYYYDVEESTGGSLTGWVIGSEYVDNKEESDELSAQYGPTIMPYDKGLVGDSNPKYMVCLADKWQMFRQGVSQTVGTTYILTCDYYLPANAAGSIRFYGGDSGNIKILTLSGGAEGTRGKAVLEYTLDEQKSWFAVGAQQDTDNDGYYWNFCLTTKDSSGKYSSTNLLQNGDFATGDFTSWVGYGSNDKVVVYDTKIGGDANPKYMAKLYGTYTNSSSQTTTWKEIYKTLAFEAGKTYVLTCDYYMPAGATGHIRINSHTSPSGTLEALVSGGTGGKQGSARLEYTAKEEDTWVAAAIMQDTNSGGVGYYWNLQVTEKGSDTNILTNGNFAIDDIYANKPEKMTLRLFPDDNADYRETTNTIVANQWARVIFDLSNWKETHAEAASFSQMHFFPWGRSQYSKGNTAEGTMYINNLSFYTSEPGLPTITDISFVSVKLEVLCGGSVNVPTVIVSGENYPITAYDLELSGHSSANTYIRDGKLYVGSDETATTLNITAKAITDNTAMSTCKVSVVNSINRSEFDENNVVTRFGVVSDTHLSGSWNQERSIGKFAHMIDVFQKTAADDGAKLDALLVNGDFVDAVASPGNVITPSLYGSKETQNFREVNYVAQGLWGTNPEYMLQLAGGWNMLRQGISGWEKDDVYKLTCDYYMPAGSDGSIRFYGGTDGNLQIEAFVGSGSGNRGKASVEWTVTGDENWFAAGPMQGNGTGYYWNFCLTKNDSSENLLKNADFGTGTWDNWVAYTENDKIVPYDATIVGDSSQNGLNKTDTTTGYGVGLYEGTRLFYSLGNHDEGGEGKTSYDTAKTGYDTVYSAEYFAAVFCGWQYDSSKEKDDSYRNYIADLIDYNTNAGTAVTADSFYSAYGVTLASADAKFDKYYGYDTNYSDENGLLYGNRHMKIGEGNDALHFVALELSVSETSLQFLEEICEQSVAENSKKPIFVITHYKVSEDMPGYTGMRDRVREVMAKYPQIVVWGGHSHSYLHSDMAIDSNEGFIQVDSSTTAYASQNYLTFNAKDANNNIVYAENAAGSEKHAYSMGCYVEVDKNFNVRINRIDLYRSYSADYAQDSALYSDEIFTNYSNMASAEPVDTAVFVREAWDITDIGTVGLHLSDYTEDRITNNQKPVLTDSSKIEASTKGTTITANLTLDGTDKNSQGKDGLVYMYVVELWNADTEELITTKYYTNNFYDYQNGNQIPVLEEIVEFTGLVEGTAYEIKAYPKDEFNQAGDAISVTKVAGEPDYMAKLIGTYVDANGNAQTYKEPHQFISVKEGTTYEYSFNYFIPEEGIVEGRLMGEGWVALEKAASKVGEVGTIKLTYTAKASDTWVAPLLAKDTEGIAYVWNLSFNEVGKTNNLLKNGDFSEGEGSWIGWTVGGISPTDKTTSDTITTSFGHEIMKYDRELAYRPIAKGATLSTTDYNVKMAFKFTSAARAIEARGETVEKYGTVLYAGTKDLETMQAKAEEILEGSVDTEGSGYTCTSRTGESLPDVYTVLIENSNSDEGIDTRGKRITALAYIVTDKGVYYSHDVINHSVMSVLKAIFNETYLKDENNVDQEGNLVSGSLLAKALEQEQITYVELKNMLAGGKTTTEQRTLLFDIHYALNEYGYVLGENSSLKLYAQRGGADAESATLRTAIMDSTANTEIKGTGSVYYISSQNGDDANAGNAETEAWASLDAYEKNRGTLKSGDTVLFERGGVYRGNVTLVSGVTYGAYGTGSKPAIYGSEKNYSYEGAWTKTDTENVWICSDKVTKEKDIGTIVFDHGWAAGRRKYNGVSELSKNFDFYQNLSSGEVYLYLDRNPVEAFEDIEFCVKGHIFYGNENTKNITIDRLSIKYGGSHGVRFDNGAENITITNCEMGWIGGSLQSGDGTSFENDASIRYGNAIEFWNSCSNIQVKNNWVYQIYDAGITHQGGGVNEGIWGDWFNQYLGYTQSNITFDSNLIEYCSYGIEYFTGNPKKDKWENISYTNNIIRFSGLGWGQVRHNPYVESAICGWGRDVSVEGNNFKNFKITDNIFDLSKSWLIVHCYNVGEGENNIVSFERNTYYHRWVKEYYVAFWTNMSKLDGNNQQNLENSIGQIDSTAKKVQYWEQSIKYE